MIDEKKIEEAARAYCDATYGTLKEEPFIAESFRQGAEWAQKEFVKSLWYAPIVKAEPRRDIIAISKKGMVYAFKFEYDNDWRRMFHRCNIERFCYLDDIMPKEGGEE